MADYSVSTSYVPKSKQFGFSIMTDSVGNSYVLGSVKILLKQWLILLAILPSGTMKINLLKFILKLPSKTMKHHLLKSILKHEEESMSVRSCSRLFLPFA
jgi:hypothetical protein